MSNVFTPVNAIVDGIGPLILPLIGYSRQALTSYIPQTRGVANYQPSDGKPVQLRNLQSYTPESTWTAELARAQGQKIQQVKNSPIDINKASDVELLQALQQSAQNNPALLQALQRYQSSNPQVNTQQPQKQYQVQQQYQRQQPLPQSVNRPYARYIPNPISQQAAPQASQESMNAALKLQEERRLSIIRSALIQEKIAQMKAQRTQEIVGSTIRNEPAYYGPQLDRYIGQSALLTENRQHQSPPTQPLPVDHNPDPGYAKGLQKVSAFLGDSGMYFPLVYF